MSILLASLLMATIALAQESENAPPEEVTPEEAARRLRPVAKVNDVTITVGEFETELNKQGPFRRVQFSSPEKRLEFLEQMIEWELQALHAQKQGYGDDPTVDDQIKRVMSSLLLRREVDDRIRPEDITDEEMQGYYQENITTFKRPERVRAYHIMISDREKAQSLLNRVLEENVDTREFRRLAREMSEDAITKRRGGDLRYFTHAEDRTESDPEVDPAIVKATFDLLKQRRATQGDKAPGKRPAPSKADGFNPIFPKLVQTEHGYHIIRFMGHRDAVNREFVDVERQIRNRIWREKLQKSREDFIGSLREKHKVSINEDNLALIKIAPAPVGADGPRRVKSGLQNPGRRIPGRMGKRGPGGEPPAEMSQDETSGNESPEESGEENE
jgi:peptidyl-prolyl cis-trans isomerase C